MKVGIIYSIVKTIDDNFYNDNYDLAKEELIKSEIIDDNGFIYYKDEQKTIVHYEEAKLYFVAVFEEKEALFYLYINLIYKNKLCNIYPLDNNLYNFILNIKMYGLIINKVSK